MNGIQRQYYVVLPTNYSSSRTWPIVFAWHPRGGTAEQVIGRGFGGAFYGLKTLMPNAIYVAGQGLNPNDAGAGWPNTNDEDVVFTRAMLASLEASYCLDAARIFSTGFSYGGIMSDTIGCEMGDVFRALGVMSGSLFGGRACTGHPIAAWITHGDADTTLAIAGDQTARDTFLAANKCGTTSHAVSPAPCVAYDGCPTNYPVVWCPVAGGGHTIPSFAAGAIANFFLQF